VKEKRAKQVQEFFKRVASDWDTMRLAYYDERVIEKMAEVSGIGEASQAADVGTGTGFVAAGLAPQVERVVGIDNAPAMLEIAGKNLRAMGAWNVDLARWARRRGCPWTKARWTRRSPTWCCTTPRTPRRC
jgi:ubiquinone/menaquinone biosynthesis C-methylase UbiE